MAITKVPPSKESNHNSALSKNDHNCTALKKELTRWQVIEINASDERSAASLKQRIENATQMRSVHPSLGAAILATIAAILHVGGDDAVMAHRPMGILNSIDDHHSLYTIYIVLLCTMYMLLMTIILNSMMTIILNSIDDWTSGASGRNDSEFIGD